MAALIGGLSVATGNTPHLSPVGGNRETKRVKEAKGHGADRRSRITL
jgi:hypothetical protein